MIGIIEIPKKKRGGTQNGICVYCGRKTTDKVRRRYYQGCVSGYCEQWLFKCNDDCKMLPEKKRYLQLIRKLGRMSPMCRSNDALDNGIIHRGLSGKYTR